MGQVHVVGGQAGHPAEGEKSGNVVSIKPVSPYVVLLTQGKPPHNVVQAILEQGYAISAESNYSEHYTTQFKRE